MKLRWEGADVEGAVCRLSTESLGRLLITINGIIIKNPVREVPATDPCQESLLREQGRCVNHVVVARNGIVVVACGGAILPSVRFVLVRLFIEMLMLLLFGGRRDFQRTFLPGWAPSRCPYRHGGSCSSELAPL